MNKENLIVLLSTAVCFLILFASCQSERMQQMSSNHDISEGKLIKIEGYNMEFKKQGFYTCKQVEVK